MGESRFLEPKNNVADQFDSRSLRDKVKAALKVHEQS